MRKLKVALVHDQISEYGGAERVLEALCEIYPNAPIYTAYYRKDGTAWSHFKNRKIIPSWAQNIPFFTTKLHSPLRFLAPLIWGSFNFSKYDVVITSASWYITKGMKKGKKTVEICYCHTPPRWLYGYKTSVGFQKYWIVKVYAAIVGHFMRMYDFNAAQKVDYFIANSKEVKARIEKFYRRDATVIYPPATLSLARRAGPPAGLSRKSKVESPKSRDYYFIVSRIVGAKGLELAIETAKKLGIKLKIAGSPGGYYSEHKKLKLSATDDVQFLGHVTDEELVDLYSGAKAFLALATDEDFGITPVEAMSLGTPVIAYFGGGYKETVIDPSAGSGQATGIFYHKQNVESLTEAIKKFERLKISPTACKIQAEKFTKERFKKEIREFVKANIKE